MIYEFFAKGTMGIDGVEVRAGHLVARVDTEFPVDSVMSAIRMQTLIKSEPKPPPPAMEPPANETTTKGQAPPGGKTRKTK